MIKIVKISDIEDLIESKIEIDKYLISTNQIDSKLSLETYMNKYCNISEYSYMKFESDKEMIAFPFTVHIIGNTTYLYISDLDSNSQKIIDKIKNILNQTKSDITKLDIINGDEMLKSVYDINNNIESNKKSHAIIETIVHNNVYYKI